MRLEIDIAEHHYNNIMALDSVSLGRAPYKGIIMYSINAIKHGKVLEQEPTTKNNLEVQKAIEIIKADSLAPYSVNEILSARDLAVEALKQMVTTKNDLGVDCISRADALALFCDKCGLYNCISKCASYRAVEKMPSVTPQQRWIPVSEGLPEIHNYTEKYLVTLERGCVRTALCTQCDGKHWWSYDDVVAWMPLPKPYKAESEE